MPGGRPSNIDTIIGRDDNGRDVTVADRIVQLLRTGAYFEQACAVAGVHKETAYGWLRIAGRLRIVHRGDLPAELGDHDRRCVEFSDAVLEAEATWEVVALGQLERLGRGGIDEEVTTEEHDDAGKLTKKVTRKSVTLPDARVLMWRLERRFPSRYGRRDDDAPSGADRERSHSERVDDLVDVFEAYLAGRADAEAEAQAAAPVTIDATSSPSSPRKRRPRPRKAIEP